MTRIEEALARIRRQRSAEAAEPLGRLSEPSAPEDGRDVGRKQPEGRVAHLYRQDRRIEIDYGALRRAGLLAPENQDWKLSEEYRQIKRPLLANASRRGAESMPRGNLIMIASAVSGEGKTFSTINLCLSLALEKDWFVVLVDGDAAKPHLTGLFGLQAEPGFMDLLHRSDKSFDDYVVPTNVPGLAMMPTGHTHEHAAELLASTRMDTIAEHLAGSDPRRVVIFDSPPLLMTSEAPVLASQVGQIVLVVHAGHTSRARVRQALGKLDPTKAVNLILNQAEAGGDKVPYAGQYGYASDARGTSQA